MHVLDLQAHYIHSLLDIVIFAHAYALLLSTLVNSTLDNPDKVLFVWNLFIAFGLDYSRQALGSR